MAEEIRSTTRETLRQVLREMCFNIIRDMGHDFTEEVYRTALANELRDFLSGAWETSEKSESRKKEFEKLKKLVEGSEWRVQEEYCLTVYYKGKKLIHPEEYKNGASMKNYVDILIIRDNQPWCLLELKHSEKLLFRNVEQVFRYYRLFKPNGHSPPPLAFLVRIRTLGSSNDQVIEDYRGTRRVIYHMKDLPGYIIRSVQDDDDKVGKDFDQLRFESDISEANDPKEMKKFSFDFNNNLNYSFSVIEVELPNSKDKDDPKK